MPCLFNPAHFLFINRAPLLQALHTQPQWTLSDFLTPLTCLLPPVLYYILHLLEPYSWTLLIWLGFTLHALAQCHFLLKSFLPFQSGLGFPDYLEVPSLKTPSTYIFVCDFLNLPFPATPFPLFINKSPVPIIYMALSRWLKHLLN